MSKIPDHERHSYFDWGCLMIVSKWVSVIVQVLNEEKTILVCISRLLEQEFVAEIVVVDDGSSDCTVELVKSVRDPRLALLQLQVSRGKGAAIRKALPICSAHYVVIQDADLEFDQRDMEGMLRQWTQGTRTFCTAQDSCRRELFEPSIFGMRECLRFG